VRRQKPHDERRKDTIQTEEKTVLTTDRGAENTEIKTNTEKE
jgi:hypothetical protein